MKTQLVVVRDQKSNSFTQPVAVPTRAAAVRSWGDQLNDPENKNQDQARHPEDFSLWHVGEYDDNTGEITPLKPEQLVVASDLKK